MISSKAFAAVYKGKLAQISVLRNNGSCWGRLVLKSGKEYDITTGKDWYDQCDEDAAVAFERAAKRRGSVGPALGWTPTGWAAVMR